MQRWSKPIRNAEVRGSTPPLLHHLVSMTYSQRHRWLFWPTGQYLDIFSGAELDCFNRHPLDVLNGSHITHCHPNMRVSEKLSDRERITTCFGQTSSKRRP